MDFSTPTGIHKTEPREVILKECRHVGPEGAEGASPNAATLPHKSSKARACRPCPRPPSLHPTFTPQTTPATQGFSGRPHADNSHICIFSPRPSAVFQSHLANSLHAASPPTGTANMVWLDQSPAATPKVLVFPRGSASLNPGPLPSCKRQKPRKQP